MLTLKDYIIQGVMKCEPVKNYNVLLMSSLLEYPQTRVSVYYVNCQALIKAYKSSVK